MVLSVMIMSLQGVFTAMITPFDSDRGVDYAALEKIIQNQLSGGVEGLVPCGTTGESPTLNHFEHQKVIAKTVEVAKSTNDQCLVIAGTGSNSTKEAIELTKKAGEDGADYALVVNPYYNKPTQQGLIDHFTAIAEESKIPLVLYNIPGRTAIGLGLDAIIKLSEHDNIQAIKEATGDINFMTQVILNTEDNFSLLSGDDNLLLPILSIGGRGVISVISNIFPKQTSDVARLFFAGDYPKAKDLFMRLFPICQGMFYETNPIPVKYAASTMGLCENILRLPMTSLSKKNSSRLDGLLKSFL